MLKPKDLDILRYIEKQGFTTTRLVKKFGFYGHVKSVNRKFSEFQKKNLIKKQQPFRHKPPIYELTAKAMRAIDKPNKNPPSGPKYDEFEHDLTVAHLTHSIFYELAIEGGYRTEREIYKQKGINPEERIPDLILDLGDGDEIAIEFENSKKKFSRLREIIDDTGKCNGYGPKGSSPFKQIHWISSNRSILKRIGRAIPFNDQYADFTNHFTTGIFNRSDGWITRKTKNYRRLKS